MHNETNKQYIITGFSIAGILTIFFITAATIGGELYTPFKAWLAGTFSHHWVGKGILALAVFAVFGAVFSLLLRRRGGAATALISLMWISILGTAAITGFYVYEYLAHL